MNKFLENLQTQAEENPVLALGVAAGLITAISKLANTGIDMKKSKDWSKEIDRRIKIANKK
jgi:hypothetical protein